MSTLHQAILVSMVRWSDAAADAAAASDIEAMRTEILLLSRNLKDSTKSLEMLMRRVQEKPRGP